MQTPTRIRGWLRSLGRAGALSLLTGAAALSSSGCGKQDNPATVSFSWVLIKASYPDPATAPAQKCGDVGVDKIRLEIGSIATFDYPCTSMAAQSLTVPADHYHVRVSALGMSSVLIQSVEFPNLYVFGPTPLGQVRIVVP